MATYTGNIAAAGQLLMVWAVNKASAAVATPTVTDDQGNTWNTLTAVGITSRVATVTWSWAIANAGGVAPTVSVAWATTSTLETYIAEFTPPFALASLTNDVGPTIANSSVAGTTWSGPTLALSGTANDLTVCLVIFTANWSTTTAPWTSLGSQQGDEAAYAMNQSGSTTPSGTCASSSWSSAAMAFAPVAAIPPQSVLPDADVTTTGWTTTPLFSKVNDASDTTFITSTV